MPNRSEPNSKRQQPVVWALAALVTGAGLLASVAVLAFLGVMPVSAQATSCESFPPVTVHYETAVGSYRGISSGVAVSGVDLSGFPTGCDGHTVTLQMWGNSAGDPSEPFSADTLLSTANSALDPCTQAPLASPVVVANGSITLTLCPTHGVARYASVHDLTALNLLVSATTPAQVVKGQSTTAPTSTSSSSPGKHGGTLAATTPSSGAHLPVSLAEFLLLLGFALVVIGLWAWRRERYPSQS